MIMIFYNCNRKQKAIENTDGEELDVLHFAKVAVALNRVSGTRSDLRRYLEKH